MRASNLPPARVALLLVAGAALAAVAVLGALWATGAFASQEETRQEEIAEKGARVMPFDLEETTHVFEKTHTGGVQEVVADDPNDAEQVALIREHLEEEAAAFRRGDLSDPSEIHGEKMPGLEALEAGAERMDIRYSELPDGAKIEYETSDPVLVAALHEWFDAQVSDHGATPKTGPPAPTGAPPTRKGTTSNTLWSTSPDETAPSRRPSDPDLVAGATRSGARRCLTTVLPISRTN